MSEDAGKKEEKKKQKTLNILYLGEDLNYWQNVQGRFSNVCTLKCEFETMFREDGKVQQMFGEIIQYPYDIIYVDFTKFTAEMKQLARIINRNNLTRSIVLVALLDHQADQTEIKKAILAGVNFAHIKSTEMHDVVFDPVSLIDAEAAKEPEYATAQMADDISVSELGRINWINLEGLCIEYDRPIVKDSEFSIQTDFLNTWMPSSMVKVTNVITSGFYYNFSHKFEVKFLYMDEEHYRVPENDDDDVPSKEEQVAEVKRKFYKWIEDNVDRSRPKNNKVLVVNKDSTFFNEGDKGLDKYPFVLRYQPFLIDAQKEIKRLLPNIIAIQIEKSRKEIEEAEKKKRDAFEKRREELKQKHAKESEEFTNREEEITQALSSDDEAKIQEARENQQRLETEKKEWDAQAEEEVRFFEEEEKQLFEMGEDGSWQSPLLKKYFNDFEALTKIVQTVKGIEDYNPVIIVFKSLKHNSEALQTHYKYPMLIAHTTEFNYDLLINLAKTLQKKTEAGVQEPPKIKVGSRDVPNHTIVFNKINQHSILEVEYPIVMVSMKENEIGFTSPAPITEGTVFKASLPMDDEEDENLEFFVTAIPGKSEGGDGGEVYRGLIHGIGEDGKKQIRKYINAVFFREKDQQKKAELEEFKKKNQEAAEKKGKGQKKKAKTFAKKEEAVEDKPKE
jgi:hypothetical protein